MTLLDWMIVVLCNGFVIAYGFRVAGNKSSKTDWYLAGRKLPWWALGLSILARAVGIALWTPNFRAS